MVSAIILVNTDLGAETKVLASLKQVEGVQEAHRLCSVYDVAVNVNANSIDRLKEIVSYNIRKLSGVSDTLTLMVVD